ncbi:uncharacterized protein [Asterias amurensis]|uniref:uncharacterized protein isoform X1 n=1 Tax=Asterias amurensis TaxID=7602 RepID=UPI003AB483A6
MGRQLILSMTFLVLMAHQTLAQECAVNQCENGETCYTRNSAEGYVCECNLPFRDNYNCAAGPDNQEIYTCYGSSCTTGTFVSKNYPSAYPNRYRALYLLYIPGANGIRFTFNNVFGIETDKDELYIGRGLTVDFNALNGVSSVNPDVFFFEGFAQPADFVVPDTDTVWMYFITDKNLEFSGFSVSWQPVDTAAPVITNCPSDITQPSALNQATQVFWTAPTATDASEFTTSVSHFPGTAFPVGSTIVTYLFTDTLGNSNACSFTVNVVFVDSTPPVINGCPSNIIVSSSSNQGTSVFWTAPTATDISQVSTQASNAPGDNFSIGNTQVSYLFTDASGNTAVCSFQVTVQFVDTTPPTVSNCPQSFTRTASFGVSSIAVSWVEPTATDNLGTPTLSIRTPVPGSQFAVGQTTSVLYRWTDSSGNTADCSFDVTVISLADNDAPVVTFCPDDITMFVPFQSTGTTVSWTAPTAVDNSGAFETTQTHASGTFFATGVSVPVTYTFTDASNNQATCTFTVRVFQQNDNIAPIVSNCPDNQAVNVPFGSTGTTVSWNEPTVTDNSGAFTTTQTRDSGTFFNSGTQTQVTYTFTDAANNQAFCSFTVTVVSFGDTSAPTVTNCPADITTFVPFLNPGTTVTWTEPSVNDNSGAFDTTQTRTSGSFFSVGDSSVVYTFTDAAGNQATCEFLVRVIQQGDNEAPDVVNCPESTSVTVPFQSTGTTVSWNEPTVTDNSGAFTTTQTRDSGTFFNSGTQTQVTYTFTDAANNQAFCSFTVTVVSVGDTSAPTVTNCPADITTFVPFLNPGTTVTWTEPSVNDNSGAFDTTQTRTSGSFFSVGDSSVVYTFTDAAGNQATCEFLVRVIQQGDNEAPDVGVCPESTSVTVPFQSTGTTVSWNEPTVTDNSGAFTTTQTRDSGTFFNSGTQTQVTYTFTDAANNQAFCSFTVTVVSLGDTSAPTVTNCPADITTFVPFLNPGTTVTWTEPSVNDNSGAFDTTQTRTSGSFFSVGDSSVVYTFTDAAGNQATCEFLVRVIQQGDNEAPDVVNCPESTSVTVPFQSTGTTVSWNEPTVTDNSGAFTTTQTRDSGTFFNTGTQTQVTYTFTDAANNQAFCSFTVTVVSLGDTSGPTVTNCPADITTFVPFLNPGTTVTWTEPSVNDNSGAFDTTQTRTSGSFFSVGDSSVVYTFTDAAGNQATCEFLVRVIQQGDNEAPVVVNCPESTSVTVPFQSTGTTVSWNEPTVTDNSGAFTTTQTRDSGTFFNSGTQTQVTYTFTDAANNQAFCSFTVTVVSLGDTSAPTVTNCPADITTFVPFLNPGTTVTWTEPSVNDNSGAFDTTQTRTSGSFFSIGDSSVVYTFADAAGNQATCEFLVRVVQQGDNEAPVVVNCPESTSVTVPFQSTGTTVSWNEPTVTDNSGAFTTTQTRDSGTFFNSGTQTQVTYTFTDAANNQAFCSFTVTVVSLGDTSGPTVTNCPADITTFVPFLNPGTTVTWTEPSVNDNSGAFDTTQTRTSGSFFSIGDSSVVYTFTDAAGNQATCEFLVRVIQQGDNEAPDVVNCPESTSVTVPFQSTGTTVSWNEPTVTDNSGAFTTTQTRDSGTFFNSGTQTQVTYTFTDAANNQAFCSFTVTVVSLGDTSGPTVTNCPADITTFVPFLNPGTTVTWTEPSVNDNSGAFDTTQTRTSGSFFSIGDSSVVYTFTDAAGNQATCEFLVRVIQQGDNEAPDVGVCPESTSVTVPFQSTGTTVSWNEPTVTDNSGAFTTTQTRDSGTFFNTGTQTQVTYTFTDAANNQAFCSFTVTVVSLGDTSAPIVTNCPADITTFVPFLNPGTTVTWTEPSVNDNSGAFDTTQTRTSGSFFSIGDSSVVYTFTDAAGNQATCEFLVRVIQQGDNEAPDVGVCPESTSVTVPFQSTGTTVSWNEPTVTDNSGAFTTTQTRDSGTFFNTGTQTQVTYTFTDAANNQAFCSFTVTVVSLGDTVPPVVEFCPQDITEFVPFLTSGTSVTWTMPTVNDNSGAFDTTQTRASGSFFSVGDSPVVYTFTDAAGNQNTCSFVVRVIQQGDTVPPVVVLCPDSVAVTVPYQSTGTSISWNEPTATDNSGAFTTTQTRESGTFFNTGTQTQVTYTFTDAANNQAVCTFTVTVTEQADPEPPMVVCPPNQNEVIQFGAGGAVITWNNPTVSDNSGSFSLIESSHNSGNFLPTGQTVVTYRYADDAGNENSCSFVVNIVEVDSIPPVLTSCPGNLVEQVQFGVSGTTATWEEPTASDNTGQTVVISQRNFLPGSFFPVGDTTVTYVLMDPSGNEVTCQFIVTVIAVDSLPPTLLFCPSDIVRTVVAGDAPVPVNFVAPTATDNTGVVNLVFNTMSPGDSFPAGSTQVTYFFEDEAGNSVSCIFTVTIEEVDACLSQPCLNGGICIPDTLTSYRCVCTDCFTGDRCSVPVNACDNNVCQNGAACAQLSGSCTQYDCQCPQCYTGQYCDVFVDSCENNQCTNGAVCATDSDNCLEYTCQCPSCFTGRFCDIPISACASNNCANGAVCVPSSNSPNSAFSCSEYTCSCSGCFTGERCESQRDACNPSPCVNGAVCSTLPDSCYSYACQCTGCFTGYNCELPIASPCADNPCLNGGVCTTVQGTCSAYVCSCPNTHIGINCETSVIVNLNPCNSFPCQNGASCLTMDGSYYICLCTTNFVGTNCQTSIANIPAMDLCDNTPCLNNGDCYNSYNSNSGTNLIPQYTCVCGNGFTGSNCALTTGDNPTLDICVLSDTPNCEQGAPCSNTFHSFDQDVDYFCTCPVGFIGHNCETISPNPCASNPCKNGAQCVPTNTFYTCQCATGYSGSTCEIPVGDNTDPVISGCPQSITMNVQTGSSAVVTWTPPTATDNSGTAFIIFSSSSPGSVFPAGTTPVSYVFSDPSQNYASCSFFVTVTGTTTDNIPPVISNCPNNILQTAAPGATSATVSWTVPSATDNSGNTVNRVSTVNPGASFNIGSTTVTYTFSDNSGNDAVCSFIVTVNSGTVVDNTAPVISNCPMSASATAASGTNTAVVTWTVPTATDNSGGVVTSTSTHNSGDSFTAGITTVTYTFSDPTGNQATCQFVVMVNDFTGDTVAPVISGCPNSQTISPNAGANTATATWIEPTATDNSGRVPGVASSHTPPASFPANTVTRVSYVFFDNVGNFDQCDFQITVTAGTPGTDTTAPVISNCPAGASATAAPGASSAFVSWVEPTAVDNDGQTVNVARSQAPSTSFNIGTTSVSYTFTDTSGNQARCNFNVVVTSGGTVVDNTAPVISNCPMSASATAVSGTNTAVVTWTVPTATDNSGGVVTSTSTHNSGDSFTTGVTTVTYTFSDPTGNQATCQFVVIVNDFTGDTQAPVISGCPVSRSVAPDAGTNAAIVSWVEPTATDNSGRVPGVARSHTPPASFPANTVTRVSYIFYDNVGNFDECSFTITVSAGSGTGTDTTAPVISGCPSGASAVTSTTGASAAIVSWVEPTATDNDGQAVTVSRSQAPFTAFNIGSTPVTYVFTDTAGNQATCTFNVVVTPASNVDNLSPVFSFCPNDITTFVQSAGTTATASWTVPSVTDNSGVSPQVSSNFAPNSAFSVGTTVVQYTATDNTGNQATCGFNVNVIVDSTAPVISGCPAGRTETLPTGATSVTSVWTEPTATDNNGAVTTTRSHAPGDTFNQGATAVTYIFADTAGNQATCSFLVTVNDATTTNPCNSNPCPAGQNCYYNDAEYLCLAQRRKRDAGDDECLCKNGGVCTSGDDYEAVSRSCLCPADFTGILCEKAIVSVSLCKPNPCANNGTCVEDMSSADMYTCLCSSGWEGYHCKQAVGEYEPRHEVSIPTEAYQGMQLLVGCFMAVLGTVIIILAATICRLIPKRNQKFRIDETHLVH